MSNQTKINGLLSQKPDSPVPHVGDKRRYSVTPRISKTGKDWNKIKNEGEGFGQLYEVMTVAKTDFVDSHGNVSFNVDLVDLSGGDAGSEAGRDGVATSGTTNIAQPAQLLRSTTSNGAIADNDTQMAACLARATSVLDGVLEGAIAAATPDARLDAVLRVGLSLFIQGNK